jgi:hypothetical protein
MSGRPDENWGFIDPLEALVQRALRGNWFSPELGHTLDGPRPTEGWKRRGWAYVRNRLKEIQINDRVIPFPKEFRIGPVGRVTNVLVEKWKPTLKAHEALDGKDGLGRRIEVEWEKDGMPPNGRLATVPKNCRRPKVALALHAMEELTLRRFQELYEILANPSNWTSV